MFSGTTLFPVVVDLFKRVFSPAQRQQIYDAASKGTVIYGDHQFWHPDRGDCCCPVSVAYGPAFSAYVWSQRVVSADGSMREFQGRFDDLCAPMDRLFGPDRITEKAERGSAAVLEMKEALGE